MHDSTIDEEGMESIDENFSMFDFLHDVSSIILWTMFCDTFLLPKILVLFT